MEVNTFLKLNNEKVKDKSMRERFTSFSFQKSLPKPDYQANKKNQKYSK